jgi:hypothetical protein
VTDEQLIDVIASVCDFDRAGVERWRTEALIIGRAVEQASRRAALEESWEAVHAERLTDPTDSTDDIAYNVAVQDCENAIRALKDGQHE